MYYQNFTMQADGFVGHLAAPDAGGDRAVIVVMGGEQSVLPGLKIAERFADYGIAGLTVALYGAPGLPQSPDRCKLEVFGCAVRWLQGRGYRRISIYGMSMGSIFALLAAQYIGGMENVVLVSPTHVPFEGTTKDKKQMTGHSVATWQGRDLPFVRPDFPHCKPMRYRRHPAAAHPVLGMWCAYYDAYADKAREAEAALAPEATNARILLIAGGGDEAWPAEYSVRCLQKRLDDAHYPKDYKAVVYPGASHLTGMMPNPARERWLFRLLPLVRWMYRSLGANREVCMRGFEVAEREIVEWLK